MRFKALDSWRGICALIVALFHYPIEGSIRFSPLVANGYLFVDFLFVLSGFVIATAYGDRLRTGGEVTTFLIRRYGRIWPLHAAMLAVFVAAAVVKGELDADERHSIEAIFTNLALVHGLGVHGDLTWNGPSWSISVEALLYLIFAFTAAMKGRLIIFALLAMIGVVVLAFEAPHGMVSTFDYGIFRGLCGFFTGCLVAQLPRRSFGTLTEAAVTLAMLAFVGFSPVTLAAPLVFGATVYVFAGSAGLFNRVLSSRPAVTLGDWSYSIYMVHAAVVAAIWAITGPLGLTEKAETLDGWSPLMADLAAIPYLIVIVAISGVSYTLVENPGRRFFNRLAATASREAVS